MFGIGSLGHHSGVFDDAQLSVNTVNWALDALICTEDKGD